MNFYLNQNLDVLKWDQFVKTNSLDGGFLQSGGWGEFQSEVGRKVWRLAVEDNSQIVAVALLIKHQLPLGRSYLYSPRGPVVVKGKTPQSIKDILDFFSAEIRKLAKSENSIFWRLDPAWIETEVLQINNFRHIGQVQPKSTLVLDLTRSEEELLKDMKAKTRYNIKVGERHGVKVEFSQGETKDFSDFWELMGKTATRDRIKTHQRDYYLKMLKIPGVKLALARSQNLASGRPLVSNIMAFFGDWCVYFHGASDYEFRDKMAPYILQWEMIKSAKKLGCRYYDFWGVDEKLWPGVTRFKVGFAPASQLTKYVGAYDLVFDKLFYFLYNLSRRLKF